MYRTRFEGDIISLVRERKEGVYVAHDGHYRVRQPSAQAASVEDQLVVVMPPLRQPLELGRVVAEGGTADLRFEGKAQLPGSALRRVAPVATDELAALTAAQPGMHTAFSEGATEPGRRVRAARRQLGLTPAVLPSRS